MNRRSFLSASIAAAAPLGGLALAGSVAVDRHYLELRRYRLPYGSGQRRFHTFFEEAAIPALERAGVGPIGVFNVMYGTNDPTLYVLLSHANLESFATLKARLSADSAFAEDAAAFSTLPLNDPGFLRYDVDLLRAFSQMPAVEIPPQKQSDSSRIFELRRYESHSEEAARRKIEMFNEGGELAIFRKTGLRPVFFGEAVAGRQMPNLTYMLVFDDMASRDAAWAAFGRDPDWASLSADSYYADTVSAITDEILRPARYSHL